MKRKSWFGSGSGSPRRKLLFVSVLMLLTVLLVVPVSAERGLSYRAPFGTPVIDGSADAVWDSADWTGIDMPYAVGEQSACSARVKVLHDDTFIYFLADIVDTTVGTESDYLEFYLDESGQKGDAYDDTCYELLIGIDSVDRIREGVSNTVLQAGRIENYAIGTDNGSYILEWAVRPSLPMDHDFAMEFMYNDSDESGMFLWGWRWNVDTIGGDTSPQWSPKYWGTLILADGAVTASGTEDAAEPEAAPEEAAETEKAENFTKTEVYSENTFTDVASGDWYYEGVKAAYEYGLMVGKGEGAFDISSNITISEVITIAARIRSIYETGSDAFPASTPWYQSYVDYAFDHGIIASKDWEMTKKATRAEFAMILANALPDEALPAINEVDDDAIPDLSVKEECGPAVYKLYRAGIVIGGSGNVFEKDRMITRAEVAAIAARMADASLRKPVTLKK